LDATSSVDIDDYNKLMLTSAEGTFIPKNIGDHQEDTEFRICLLQHAACSTISLSLWLCW
jgi:hypothetical protein